MDCSQDAAGAAQASLAAGGKCHVAHRSGWTGAEVACVNDGTADVLDTTEGVCSAGNFIDASSTSGNDCKVNSY